MTPAILAAIIALPLTLAHLDPENAPLHAQHNDWLDRQRSADGTKCCDQADVEVLVDVRWRIVAGNYQVLLDGSWVPVPPGRLLRPNPDDPTPYHDALLFRSRVGRTIFCFQPATLF